MNSIAILSTLLLALLAATNATPCKPVLCMLACPFGFAVDSEGCEHCSCRTAPSICFEPLFGYNCGTMDHRACPSTHHCELSVGGLIGQCCLKRTGTSTVAPKSTTAQHPTGTSTTHRATGTSTARPVTGTSTATTRRSMKRMVSFATGTSTQAPDSSTPAATSPSSVTPNGSTAPGASTQRWLDLVLPEWIHRSQQ